MRTVVIMVLTAFLCTGCGGQTTTNGTDSSGSSGLEPSSRNRTIRMFQKPFYGSYLDTAPFDHDLPLSFQGDGNNYMLTWWWGRIKGIWSGHNGHDWPLPEGTPVLSAGDGTVIVADFEAPFLCGNLGMVSALIVQIRHVAPSGEIFDSQYGHLSRTDVQAGQTVVAGQQIGLSGKTGCTPGPHLHFGVFRLDRTNNGQPSPVDPFGWEGTGADPWEQHPKGAQSIWLWKEGQAPEGGKNIEQVWGPGILEP